MNLDQDIQFPIIIALFLHQIIYLVTRKIRSLYHLLMLRCKKVIYPGSLFPVVLEVVLRILLWHLEQILVHQEATLYMESMLLVYLSSLEVVLNKHYGNIPTQLVTWNREELPNIKSNIRQVLQMNGQGKSIKNRIPRKIPDIRGKKFHNLKDKVGLCYDATVISK